VDADDHLVLLGGEGPVARGLDAATGATRWETRDVWPRFVAGDRVVAEVSSRAPDQDAADSVVVGLDAASGRQVWSLADRYARSEVEFVAGDVALVYARPTGADTDRDAVVMIDVSTGAEITRLGWDWGARSTCATDHSTMIARTLDQRLGRHVGEYTRMVTFDVRTHKTHPAAAKDLGDTAVRAVWDDYVFVNDHRATWAVDRGGTRVSDDLPGDIIGIDDHHVVVRLPGRGPVTATYAVS
jgi:putative pyrroloquinoline-quinone binding quinoprotein